MATLCSWEVYREFVVDHGTCHAFLNACTQIFCKPSNSLYDHSMKAVENQKAQFLLKLCGEFSRKCWRQGMAFD